MKRVIKVLVSLTVVLIIIAVMCFVGTSAATGTGYTKTGDVEYKKSGQYIYNWGAREEDCTFLSPNAVAFYTGNNTYDKLSALKGGTTQSNAPSSALYSTLQSFMKGKHSYQTSYGATRDLYKYTDSEKNGANGGKISSFYSGTLIGPNWGSSPGWNREHTWPNSKGLNGNDENDIMMLRPTAISENSSRGNTAYGKSSSYYNPNSESNGQYDLRGDVSRITLYVYVRWGNTGKMWGSGGVMESLEVLLQWMQEDPVDTWEMGRNDSVQSITGTRNVFVDYPEFAWLLFGRSVPTNMTTPSGEAKGNGTQTDGNSSGNTSENTSGNTSNNQSENNSGNASGNVSSNTSGNTGNNNSDYNDNITDNTTSSNTSVNDQSGKDDNNTTSTESGVGGIDNKPQNEGKPFDPSLLGSSQTEIEDDDFTLEAWMIIVPVAVIAAAVIAVAVIIIIRKKKIK